MEKMYDKSKHRTVYVFSIDAGRKVAVVYDPEIASKSSGNGWIEIPLKRLIPEDWVDETLGGFVSKTEKNEASHRLVLWEDGLWQTEDFQCFVNRENAIAHQLELMRKEHKE